MELFRKIWVTPDIMEDIPADILLDILCHNLDILAMAHAVPIIRECRKQRIKTFQTRLTVRQVRLALIWPRTDLFN